MLLILYIIFNLILKNKYKLSLNVYNKENNNNI
jgi:hypothetical protein